EAINGRRTHSFPFGYSQIELLGAISLGNLSRFLPWAGIIRGVGCQVSASPTRVGLVIRVLRHGCVASRGVQSDAPSDTSVGSVRAYPCRRLRRRNGGAGGRLGRSRLRRSPL